MRCRGLLALVAGLALFVWAGPAVAAQTFTDPTGDQQGTAPDVTAVVVDHDSGGTITFRVDVSNQPTLAPDSAVLIFVDTDANQATGSTELGGIEFAFEVGPDGASLAQWNGADFVPAPSSTGRFVYDRGVTFSIHRGELGNTSKFNFYAVGFQDTGPSTDPNVDLAPNAGVYSYTMTAAPQVRLGAVVLVVGQPRAGHKWMVRVKWVRIIGTNQLVVPDSVRCRATLGGRVLRGTGKGGCTFRVPATARGKRLVCRITVTVKGVSRTYTQSFTVV